MTIIDCHRFKVTAIENDSLLTCQTEVLLVFKKKQTGSQYHHLYKQRLT